MLCLLVRFFVAMWHLILSYSCLSAWRTDALLFAELAAVGIDLGPFLCGDGRKCLVQGGKLGAEIFQPRGGELPAFRRKGHFAREQEWFPFPKGLHDVL